MAISDIDPSVIKLAKRLYNKNQCELPVDVASILAGRANVKYIEIPFKCDGLSVNLKLPGKKPTVFIRPGSVENRKRFTLAHELAHVVIPWHTGHILDNITDHNGDLDFAYWVMESEANAFASEFLMPSDYMENIISEYGPDNYGFILTTISEKCKVSIPAALLRSITFMPKNNIVSMAYGEKYETYRSPKTAVHGIVGRGLFDLGQDSLPNGIKYEFEIGPYRFAHWNFPCKLPLPAAPPNEDWRSLLHLATSSLWVAPEEVHAIKNKVSAIISSVNSSLRHSFDEEEIYAQFVHRISTDDVLSEMLTLTKFHQYAAVRIGEFVKKRQR